MPSAAVRISSARFRSHRILPGMSSGAIAINATTQYAANAQIANNALLGAFHHCCVNEGRAECAADRDRTASDVSHSAEPEASRVKNKQHERYYCQPLDHPGDCCIVVHTHPVQWCRNKPTDSSGVR